MYKSKLLELCQRRNWNSPEYNTVKDGPDHMPRFTATINILGQVFETPAPGRSAKEAQNAAARIAFEHLSVPPPPAVHPQPSSVNPQFHAVPSAPLPTVPPVAPRPEIRPVAAVSRLPVSPLPSSLRIPCGTRKLKTEKLLDKDEGLLAAENYANTKPGNRDKLQQNSEDNIQNPLVYSMAIGSHDKSYKETLHMYKNRLQQYAEKQNLVSPVYTCEAEGPPHARHFKSKVLFDGKLYETLEFFPTMKEAEQAAAKVACQVLKIDVIQEDGGLFKNILQEFAQRRGLLRPSYHTVTSGLSHKVEFVSTVAVGTNVFQGAEAKTKKQAEMDAARVAYYALKGCPATEPSSVSERGVADSLAQNIQPRATIQNHEYANRGRFSAPEKVNVDAHLSGSSPSGSPPAENQPSLHGKIVAVPRKSSMLIN